MAVLWPGFLALGASRVKTVRGNELRATSISSSSCQFTMAILRRNEFLKKIR